MVADRVMQSFDAIVLGTGGVGSAAAMHLAARGMRVLGLDRFGPGHDRGSSHGHTRVIRQAYFEHPDYVPLLRRAYELWEQLEQARRVKLFHRVGVLQVGLPEGAVIAGVKASAKLHSLPIDCLTAAECRERFSGFRIDENQAAVFEPNAGYLLVERCVIEHLDAAGQKGADLRNGVEVRGWREEGKGVIVETDQGTFAADRLVITAGAWASQLLSGLGVQLRVLRKPLYWFAPLNDVYRQAPCYLYDLPEGCFYGFPQVDEKGMKLAEHSGGREVADPLRLDRQLDEADCARVAQFIERWLPQATTQLREHATCMYTMSPDEHFIVDRHPEYPQVSFAAGLSGHGFKFTNVLGEALCDLAVKGRTELPIEFLSLKRFSA